MLAEKIKNVINEYPLPELDLALGATKPSILINVENKPITVNVSIGYPTHSADLKKALTDLIEQVLQINVELSVQINIKNHRVQAGLKPIPKIKNVIAIASGKGGVGKSTTAVNLAVALQQQGASVGLLDADIYGPNQPTMLGTEGQRPAPRTGTEEQISPIVAHGIQTMSIGYLVDAGQPLVWRGPMISTALQQLLNDTAWDELDYLVIDLPPGTGDIQLTLAQKIPLNGVVIVTTPQEIALADARKAVAMFKKVHVPILGLIENMSYHVCNHCHEKSHLFGQSGGKKLASQYNLPFLGEIPLLADICELGDGGQPLTASQRNHPIAITYKLAALRLTTKLASEPKDYQTKFGTVVLESAPKSQN